MTSLTLFKNNQPSASFMLKMASFMLIRNVDGQAAYPFWRDGANQPATTVNPEEQDIGYYIVLCGIGLCVIFCASVGIYNGIKKIAKNGCCRKKELFDSTEEVNSEVAPEITPQKKSRKKVSFLGTIRQEDGSNEYIFDIDDSVEIDDSENNITYTP